MLGCPGARWCLSEPSLCLCSTASYLGTGLRAVTILPGAQDVPVTISSVQGCCGLCAMGAMYLSFPSWGLGLGIGIWVG